MPIQQNDKIIASEINSSAATNFSQGAFIYASDIAEIYGGTDNIVKDVLILAEHFQNLGLPGSGGLNGTFNGVPFKNAIADSNSGLEYIQDSNGWTLYITKGGTVNFTNFGKYGNSTDIFMIGGGGAGNKDGLSGSGGFYSTTNSKVLNNNTSYSLSIGTGGTTNGATGGATSGFEISVKGGYGGKAHTINYYYRYVTMASFSGSNLYYYSRDHGIDEDGFIIVDTADHINVRDGYSANIKCDKNGSLKQSSAVSIGGQYMQGTFYHAADGGYYQAGGTYSEGSISASTKIATRPSDELAITKIFGVTNAGGPGSASSVTDGSYYGQGGGSLGQYGSSSFGKGANGIIAIRNHR